jgi:hypothetical protein
VTDARSNDAAADGERSDPTGPLTAFQVEVAREFFAVPSAQGFLLAGGAALVAHGLTARPIQDLDLFTSSGRSDVGATLAAFAAVTTERGWDLDVVRESETFARAVVRGPSGRCRRRPGGRRHAAARADRDIRRADSGPG